MVAGETVLARLTSRRRRLAFQSDLGAQPNGSPVRGRDRLANLIPNMMTLGAVCVGLTAVRLLWTPASISLSLRWWLPW